MIKLIYIAEAKGLRRFCPWHHVPVDIGEVFRFDGNGAFCLSSAVIIGYPGAYVVVSGNHAHGNACFPDPLQGLRNKEVTPVFAVQAEITGHDQRVGLYMERLCHQALRQLGAVVRHLSVALYQRALQQIASLIQLRSHEVQITDRHDRMIGGRDHGKYQQDQCKQQYSFHLFCPPVGD